MNPDFDAIRQVHQQVLEALRRLDAGCAADAAVGNVAEAVAAFLEFFSTTIEPHMRREEAEIYPLLDRCLPGEVGSADAMLREHETLRSLVGFMRQPRRPLEAGGVAATAEAATLARDVALLLREHIRKEDGVINPLLERILRSAHV